MFKLFRLAPLAFGTVLLCLAVALFPAASFADFLKRGALAFASDDERTGVIISKGAPPSAGIFISISNAKTSIQRFDPVSLTPENSRTLFIGFDPRGRGFNKLVLPNGKEFNLQGSLTITVDKTRISIDNNNNYCSIVTEDADQPSILGLVGLEVVLNLTGNTAVALTEANQFLRGRYKELIVSYTVSPENKLLLDDKSFDGSSLGVLISAENACVEPSAIIISGTTANKLRASANRAADIQSLRANKKETRSIADFLALNTLTDSIVALDFSSGEFGVIKERLEIGEKICEFSPARL